ncbi:MAG TPA: hypothetical protein VMG41_09580 [Gemmatimonadales bacterium]|nr:hypothetical protein [Gemmatimonadales bacterium]
MFGVPEWAAGVALIALIMTGVPTIGSIVTAFAKRRGLRVVASGPDPELRQAVDALHQRVSELEERADFTERLLAKYRESERLGPGSP